MTHQPSAGLVSRDRYTKLAAVSINDEALAHSDLDWDDVVDVICAGTGPGVLAHAIFCAELDLTVELADMALPADPGTVEYLEAMTDDLGPLTPLPEDLAVPIVQARPVVVETGRRATIEPFFGSRLRDWSARCAVSPFGIIYSHVPESMTAMRAQSGDLIRAGLLGDFRPDSDRPGLELTHWLRERARDCGVDEGGGTQLEHLIFEYGKVAGAALCTSAGTRLVRATAGVALSAGPVPADWPVQAELRSCPTQVAIVSRTASRFGRVELLAGG